MFDFKSNLSHSLGEDLSRNVGVGLDRCTSPNKFVVNWNHGNRLSIVGNKSCHVVACAIGVWTLTIEVH